MINEYNRWWRIARRIGAFLVGALTFLSANPSQGQDSYYLRGALTFPQETEAPFSEFEVLSPATGKTQLIALTGPRYQQRLTFGDFPTVQYSFPVSDSAPLFASSPLTVDVRQILDANNDARVNFLFVPPEKFFGTLLAEIDRISGSDDCTRFGELSGQAKYASVLPLASVYSGDSGGKYFRFVRAHAILLRKIVRHCNFEKTTPLLDVIRARLQEPAADSLNWRQRADLASDLSIPQNGVPFDETERRQLFDFITESLDQLIKGLSPADVDERLAGVLLAYVRYSRYADLEQLQIIERIQRVINNYLGKTTYNVTRGQVYYEHFQIISKAKRDEQGDNTYIYGNILPTSEGFEANAPSSERTAWCAWYAMVSNDSDVTKAWKNEGKMRQPRLEIDAIRDKAICPVEGT
jgi:hypothetical protein